MRKENKTQKMKNQYSTRENSINDIQSFFHGDESRALAYLKIQEEMKECDPDLQFFARNGLIGLAKIDEKYRFYIAPAEDSYDIKFVHIENKMSFNAELVKMYIDECERCQISHHMYAATYIAQIKPKPG
ncbi:MAG: hypothetical protein EOM34_12295 [Clostridia bacterium]|nr:hypothetical protein [Lachnospiraceae bacterium]NCC01434.1 hypothetical protein [Clostridia bacterium]